MLPDELAGDEALLDELPGAGPGAELLVVGATGGTVGVALLVPVVPPPVLPAVVDVVVATNVYAIWFEVPNRV